MFSTGFNWTFKNNFDSIHIVSFAVVSNANKDNASAIGVKQFPISWTTIHYTLDYINPQQPFAAAFVLSDHRETAPREHGYENNPSIQRTNKLAEPTTRT